MTHKLPRGYKKVKVASGGARIGEEVLFPYRRNMFIGWYCGKVVDLSRDGATAACYCRFLEKHNLGVSIRTAERKGIHWSSVIARKTSGQLFMDLKPKRPTPKRSTAREILGDLFANPVATLGTPITSRTAATGATGNAGGHDF